MIYSFSLRHHNFNYQTKILKDEGLKSIKRLNYVLKEEDIITYFKKFTKKKILFVDFLIYNKEKNTLYSIFFNLFWGHFSLFLLWQLMKVSNTTVELELQQTPNFYV